MLPFTGDLNFGMSSGSESDIRIFSTEFLPYWNRAYTLQSWVCFTGLSFNSNSFVGSDVLAEDCVLQVLVILCNIPDQC